ncbi:heme-binding protein [Rhodococcus qingshengii]|nr:heme-binding protein [Rhodococcus qingshengii]
MNHRIYTRLPRTLAVAVPVVAILANAACSTTETPVANASSTTSISATQQPAATGDSAIVTQNRLSADAAVKAAGAALAKCRADGLGFVTVSVVDRAGNVIAMVRGDNAAQHTVEASREKAYTSAAFGADTSDLSQRTKGEGSTIADLPGTLFLAGGVTLKAGAGSIAGIGVGGAPDGMQDQACAAAGRDAIASSLG